MAVWELIRDAMISGHSKGVDWLSTAQLVNEIHAIAPETNRGSISAEIKAHCINDPSKKHYPGLRYLKNPICVADDPQMRGKRYRLLTEGERATFIAHPRSDLEFVSYQQLLEWLQHPEQALVIQTDEVDAVHDEEEDPTFAGTALLELHLQDYILRHWSQVFPQLRLHEGELGREFITRDPGVGVIDFLATDANGDFVVIETKRNVPDRQAIGQVLGYMGWVLTKLCTNGRAVRGILIAGEPTDSLRMAIAAVPNLELSVYEIAFRLTPDTT